MLGRHDPRVEKEISGMAATLVKAGTIEGAAVREDSFDLILGLDWIEQERWPRWALQEACRCLKPQGRVVFTVPNKGSGHGEESHRRTEYTQEEVCRLVMQIGLEVESCVSYGWRESGDDILRKMAKTVLRSFGYRTVFSLPFLKRYAAEHLVVGRKPVDFWEHFRRMGLRNVDRRAMRFCLLYSDMLARQAAWLSHHPEFAGVNVKEFSIEDYAGKSILVVAPHPDDEIIGCGGVLAQLKQRVGSVIHVLYVTDGSATVALGEAPEGIRRTVRLREARHVAEQLGVASATFWKEPDGELRCSPRLVTRMRDELNRLRPALILVPFCDDPHADHLAVNRILAEALETSNDTTPEVLAYEVWTLVPANRYRKIDAEYSFKMRMLMCYQTAMKAIDYVQQCQGLGVYRAWVLAGHKGFAEAFLLMDGQAYAALVKETDRRHIG